MVSWTKAVSIRILLAIIVLVIPSAAFAQRPVLIHVIALDSDDTSEDQADALTAAIRQRVRSTPAWQMAESNQSLSTLLPALRCPSRPDSACLQRIGDQLKTDRFFWGIVTKAAAHQVTAEVHLWTRGKPEQVAKETYSDNLKDQNDDALKRIAAGLFERLTGQSTQGTVIVHANGSQTGTVVVDGKPMAQLAAGTATVSLGSGSHTIDIDAPGMSTTSQTVSVVVNVQSEITFDLKANAVAPLPPSGPSHTKRTIGFITLGVAGASAITAGILGGLFAGNASTFNNYRNGISTDKTAICTAGQDLGPVNGTTWTSACNARNSADTEGSLAWTFGGIAVGLAAIGVVLVVTDHPSQEGAPPPAAGLRVMPVFGPNGGGLTASLTF